MQPFESSGVWWLPDRSDEKLTGTLVVSETGDLRLSIVGALGGPSVFGALEAKRLPVIFGSIDKGPKGHRVTLVSSFLQASSTGSYAGARETYRVGQGYFGAHLDSGINARFGQMTLQLGGLSEWASSLTGFANKGFPHGEIGQEVPLLAYVYRNPPTGTVPGGRVSLAAVLSAQQSLRKFTFKETLSISISCDEQLTAGELNGRFVYPLQNLLTFVSDRAQEVERFTVVEGAALESLGNPDIVVIGPRVYPQEDEKHDDDGERREKVHRYQMLFTLDDIDFTTFLDNWLRVTDKFVDACNVFFALQYGPPSYLDLAFPEVAQSLYLYYSRRDGYNVSRGQDENRAKAIVSKLSQADAEWLIERIGLTPRPSLQRVLADLLEEHASVLDPLISGRRDRFINEVVNTQDYIVHREDETRDSALHGAQLYWMMQKLRFLFKACLLRELGFTSPKALELFQRNDLYQHVVQLEKASEGKRKPN